ncbi:uncharacterized protein METZ01_LOCUS349387, partial [marine metagenome]
MNEVRYIDRPIARSLYYYSHRKNE